jgi:hypothetical protein
MLRVLKHRCYYRSLCLYYICRMLDSRSAYRINIMMHCSDDAWGHAWVTKNGKALLTSNRIANPLELKKIGENNRCIYWITA